MPNYEINPEFIEAQYLAGANQTEFEAIAAVSEIANSGISTEPSQQTNPILIEQLENNRRYRKLYDENFYGEEFDY